MFKQLELEQFTVFEKVRFDWAAGINVLVGANGTGKTHLLKLLYCLQMCGHDAILLHNKLATVFRPADANLKQLVRENSTRDASINTTWNDQGLHIDLPLAQGRLLGSHLQPVWRITHTPVYMPAKEVLSFAPGFISLYDKYNLAFDEVYYDVIKQAYLPSQRNSDEKQQAVLALLEQVMGGKVSIQGDTFQIGSRIMHLVAEGHRKLALIWQLVRNGSIAANNTLFWDEPESNLNPSLMQDVVKVLLMLAANGTQVFIATHNYAFLRELDFQKGDVPTRFFALENTVDHGVIPHAAESYRDIKPNKIAEEYLRLYDLEIKRSLGDV
jgi:ABC-type cobalamin/Fe3+-siderophores transport system ATPase subunit